MTPITILIASLAILWGQAEPCAQVPSTPAGEKSPTWVTTRDNLGKTVPVPAPNPAQWVNYAQWLDETLGAGIQNNAAAVYERAYGLYKELDDPQGELDQALAGPWAGLEGVSVWLTANRASMDRFRQATMKRQCYFPLGQTDTKENAFAPSPQQQDDAKAARSLVLFMIPSLVPHRNICKALIADGWRALTAARLSPAPPPRSPGNPKGMRFRPIRRTPATRSP